MSVSWAHQYVDVFQETQTLESGTVRSIIVCVLTRCVVGVSAVGSSPAATMRSMRSMHRGTSKCLVTSWSGKCACGIHEKRAILQLMTQGIITWPAAVKATKHDWRLVMHACVAAYCLCTDGRHLRMYPSSRSHSQTESVT
jgi:hypothetical protein